MAIENRPVLPDSAYDLSFAGPDAYEQLTLELINRARANPSAEAARQGTSLGSGVSSSPSEPFAIVCELDLSAQRHTNDMFRQNFFDHDNPFTGKDPFDRMRDAGYQYRAASENIGWIGGFSDPLTTNRVTAHHDNLWDSISHRRAFMSSDYNEAGLGFGSGSYTEGGRTYTNTTMITQNFGDRGNLYLTGVVIDDLDKDLFYDIGEGQGDVKITAYNSTGSWATSTWDAGGYSLALRPGTYTVVFEGGDLDGYFETSVRITDRNVKVDVVEDRDARPFPQEPDPEPQPEPDPGPGPQPGNPQLPAMAQQNGTYMATSAAEQVSVASIAGRISGTAAELAGDQIFGFSSGDRLSFESASFGRGQVSFNKSTGALSVNTNGVGPSEASLSLYGSFSGADLLVYRQGGATHLERLAHVANFRESGSVGSGNINGVVGEEYLNGSNASSFTISIEASIGAKFANSLGKFELTSGGAIVDVDILAIDAANAGRMTVNGVSPGNELAFFIIQNGANTVDHGILNSNGLGLSNRGGTIRLTNNGSVVDEAVVFVSHDASLNPDNAQHASSGLAPDGSGALIIGFEDLMRTGNSDDDFQDVAIRVDADLGFV